MANLAAANSIGAYETHIAGHAAAGSKTCMLLEQHSNSTCVSCPTDSNSNNNDNNDNTIVVIININMIIITVI